jgi:hypothetical protein
MALVVEASKIASPKGTIQRMDRTQTEQVKLAIARLRRRRRAVEREIEHIQEETRSYQRLGFDQDMKDIQMRALRDRRLNLQAEVRRLRRIAGLQPPSSPGLLSWVLLPVVLCIEGAMRVPRWARRALALGSAEPAPSERTVRY